MNAVVGIAAKSLDAAHELAKVLHGSHDWGHRQSIALSGGGSITESAFRVPAHALLLLSRNFGTAYVLVATHATAAELLRAASAAANAAVSRGHASSAGGSSQIEVAASEPLSSAAKDRRSADAGAAADASAGMGEVPTPLLPLQRIQQYHGAAVNVMLLQLFLTCDCVLVLLPTGQGLGASGHGGGGDGGPLAGATDWIARLRQLQGAKRALQHGPGNTPPAAKQLLRPPHHHQQQQQERQQQQCLQPHGTDAAGPTKNALPLLHERYCRQQPPVLFFISPSEPELPQGALGDTSLSLTSAARGAGGATTAGVSGTDPRDANWVLRNLLKRCRPVAIAATGSNTDPGALCVFDPNTLVLEPGQLALSPAQVHAVVLAALLGSEEGAIGSPGFDGIQQMREVVTAAAAGAGGGWRQLGPTEHGVYDNTASAMTAAAQRFAAAWSATAAKLHEAALAACEEAVRQPLDWVPRVEAPLPGSRPPAQPSTSAYPGSALGRGRPRASPPAGTSAFAMTSPQAGSVGGNSYDAAAWLAGDSRAGAGGIGLAARMAEELSQAAADAALQSYLCGTPKRYPTRVHAAAVAAAVAALRVAAPPGLAAAAATSRLRTACAEAWLQGRQQCSALSATGRPCSRPVHDPIEPHSSETTRWCTATTTGSSFILVPDPFDLQAANAADGLNDGDLVAVPLPAQLTAHQGSLSSGAATGGGGNKQKAAGKKAGAAKSGTAGHAADASATPPSAAAAAVTQPPLPAHSRHLLVAACQGPDGVVRQCALGPWVTVTRLGAASAYSERRGLTGQPGLQGSQMFPLGLRMDSEAATGARPALASRGRGVRGGGVGSKGPAAAASTGSAGSPDAAAAGGSDGEAGSVVLDEQSFPSLAAAVAATQAGRQHAMGPGAPSSGRRGVSSKQTQPGGLKAAACDAASVARREREALGRVWPYPHGASGGGGSGSGLGDGGNAGVECAERAAAMGGGGGAAAVRERRTRGASGTARGGPDAAAFPALPSGRDIRRVYVSYEYQTLDGRRFLASPQQLAAAAAAAAAAERGATGTSPAVSAARAPTPAAGLQPQPQPVDKALKSIRGSRAPEPSPAAAARGSSLSSTALGERAPAPLVGGANGAACYLLQHDAPLYLQPPPGLAPDAAAPEALDGAPTWDPTPRRPAGLAQLQRIFIVTPPSSSGEALLATRPTLQFRLLQPLQLPADTAAELVAAATATAAQEPHQEAVCTASGSTTGNTTATATATARSVRAGASASCSARMGRGKAAWNGDGAEGQPTGARQDEHSAACSLVTSGGLCGSVVQVSLARPVPLPPDSFLVVSLPYMYGLPAQWLGWGAKEGGGDSATKCHTNAARDALAHDQSVDGEDGQGGTAVVAASQSAACADVECVSPGNMLPLVQLQERSPFDARLLAGCALFPIPSVQSS